MSKMYNLLVSKLSKALELVTQYCSPNVKHFKMICKIFFFIELGQKFDFVPDSESGPELPRK